MRNLYRGLTSLALLTMMFFVGIGSAFAVPDMPPSVIPVVDDTRGLTAQELMMIGKTANIDDSDVKVYTYITAEIPAEHSGNIETATDEVFTAWRLEQRNGALIYIAKADGEINIQLSDTLMESLSAEDMERILSESIIPSLRENNYAQGIASGIRDIKNTVEENTTTSIIPAGFTESAGFTAIKSVLIGIVPITILVLLLNFVLRLKKAASTKIGEASQTLDNTVSNTKKAYSKTEKTLQNSSFNSPQQNRFAEKVDRNKLKQSLKNPNREDSAALSLMFNGFADTEEQDKSNNGYSSIYDGSKVLDSIMSSNSYSSSYNSSYSSSYGSGYKTSYDSGFGSSSYSSDYSSMYDSASDSGGDGRGGD